MFLVVLKFADGLTRPLPSLAVALGSGLAFYCLSMALSASPMRSGAAPGLG